MKSLTEVMKKEHKKIDEMIEEFELNRTKGSFDKFKWNLEKHFFVEEKVIFSVSNSGGSEEDNFRILRDHQDILGQVKRIEDALVSGEDFDVGDLKAALVVHAKFEDEDFYPRLDEELSEDLKGVVFDRAGEILRG